MPHDITDRSGSPRAKGYAGVFDSSGSGTKEVGIVRKNNPSFAQGKLQMQPIRRIQ
jgi:hypothetical protein